MNKKKIELLAPAGDLISAITAFDSGADAVYAGLQKFNARERAENFTEDQMKTLIEYARKIHKKVYIVLNTLIKESEIPELIDNITLIAEMQPDAVIVQDFACVKIIKDSFPNLNIHASTQMGIHSSAGVQVASQLGIKRVILERQVTFEEMELIVEKSTLEIEVFVHGALCCSMSGTCLFSSWLGGWSGNRGKCKQPCRRRYFSKEGNGFFFSTHDLATLDLIPKLKRTNISSVKIEGRLQRADYIKNAVSAYRMMLDCDEENIKRTLGEAKKLLEHTYGRRWSHGFYFPQEALIKHKNMGVSGLLCGTVLRSTQNGFMVELSRPLKNGNVIRIQPKSGDEGPGMVVTKLKAKKKMVSKVVRGKCFIFSDLQVQEGSYVYITGEKADDISSRIDTLVTPRLPLDLNIKVDSSGILIALTNSIRDCIWTKNVEIESAKKHPATDKFVIEAFQSTTSRLFRPGKITVNVAENLFIPRSFLNNLRRDFYEWVDKSISREYISSFYKEKGKEFLEKYNSYTGFLDKKMNKVSHFLKGDSQGEGTTRTVHSIYDFNKTTDEVLLPHFCPEKNLYSLAEKIKKAFELGIRTFRVTSLYGFYMLKNLKGINIFLSFPFPLTNSLALREFSENFKIKKIQPWIELEKEEILAFVKKSPLKSEIYRYGRPFILATRASIPLDGEIYDQMKNGFKIACLENSQITYLYPKEVFSIPEISNTDTFFDLTNAKLNEKSVSVFNFSTEFV